MNIANRIEVDPKPSRSVSYIRQYNEFWRWKISVEQRGNHHILDSGHIGETTGRLLLILPKWQTYRGVECSYKEGLPKALSLIASAYDVIRRYNLLDFPDIPSGPLELIWEKLGRVKEPGGALSGDSAYYVIAICKPLMFIWGQTPAFDSINRQRINDDKSLSLTNGMTARCRWTYSFWKQTMDDISREMMANSEIIHYCHSYSSRAFGSTYIIPYGRVLDIYYYYSSPYSFGGSPEETGDTLRNPQSKCGCV